jgi:transcriptional regulator with XRE-family HTH domain
MASNKLKQVLTEEGITQTELAFKSSVSIGTINRVCNKKRNVSPTTRHKILKALNSLAENNYAIHDIFP